MINNSFLLIISLSFIFAIEKAYWDLGVIIINDKPIIVQKEIDLDQHFISQSNYNQDNIKALHSNNFIPPVLYELKISGLSKVNNLKKYDNFIYSLSMSETIKFFKKSFLKNQYSAFFSTHKLFNNQTINDESINSMYIQKLYQTNQLKEVIHSLKNITNDNLTDELLLYKIKTEIKLKNYNSAEKNIQLFLDKFHNSDLLRYVICEKKLLMNKNEK